MPTITIREQGKTAAGFKARVIIENENRVEYEIPEIKDPFSEEQEKELEWYFEEWLESPTVGPVRAETAAASIKDYGENLFEQVLGHRNVYSDYKGLIENLSQLRIAIESDNPDFHALHWEALRDPDLYFPLAVDCVMVRSINKPSPVPAKVKESPTINLLVVVARPDEERDVGYRTISRPLLELIENSRLRVNLDLLRPGSYKALAQHLEAKGEGYYHLIHFDVHGALMSYEQFQRGVKLNRLSYQRGYGLMDLKPYAGVKGFLFLEGDKQFDDLVPERSRRAHCTGKAVPVEATELANLLTGKKIPVCILNACQSGKQIAFAGEEAEVFRETSVGSQLLAAGMEMVVAMGYSVTVSAAVLMMQELYRHLFAKKQLAAAIRLSRYELYQQKSRGVFFNESINLEDWLLPVVYGNGQVNLNLREFTFQEKKEYFLRRSQRYQFQAPTYGFVGRDLEIMKLEKALLKQNILLLQGMGGTGKTTLLNYLREWWQATNFAGKIFYFGYDKKAWNLEQIVFEIGSQVYEEEEERAIFQVTPLAAQVEELIELLRANDYVLILDNLESVTGQQLAIENTLPEAERNQVRDFLARLVGGNTKIVLGSRGSEDWLKERTFQDNIYQLRGLDREARTVLAQRVLERNVAENRIEKIKEDEDFTKLMKLLAGYPLAMEVVLANLKNQSPAEVLAGLQAADLELDRQGKDKTRSILKCVEYSHSNLSPDAQKLLLCLAPFSGVIWQGVISLYGEELKKLEPFKDYPFDRFDAAIEEAINWGLLSPSQDISEFITIQPIFPYFLKAKLNELDEATREALQEGFKNHYIGLALFNQEEYLDSKEAQKRQLGILFCRLEYENLYNGLVICFNKQETVNIFLCLARYLELINDIPRKLKLSQFVYQALEAYPEEIKTGKMEEQIVITLGTLATSYLDTKNYLQAREYYQKGIELIRQLSSIEEKQRQLFFAQIYHQLGSVAYELREWDEVRSKYQQALAIFIEYGDRYSQAGTYHQLGIVFSKLREWEEARQNYQQALAIFIEYGDRYSQAGTYHQLGIVAEQLREWQEARQNYQQALAINIEYGDRYKQASTYNHLGIVAEELREWEEARGHYQQALAINIEYGDRYQQAKTYLNLGNLALQLKELEEARNNYQQSLAIFIEYNDRHLQATTYQNLGILAKGFKEWEQARKNYQQALAINIEYSDRYEQAKTYNNLGNLALQLEECNEARENYQQALAINIEYGDRHSQAKTYEQLGLLAEEEENYTEARYLLNQALEIFTQFKDEYQIEKTLQYLKRIAEKLDKEPKHENQ